ncbi:ataxin-2-like protein isoform X2 [Esox lucius]|uniref:ataxin-2-like protein isoform X2 n=1 Tax=Esox lucius TaxID=8010 RepID=UPI0014772DDB|nr:ataxin-2-like protein isoform X2 [Esox lucius]
MLKPQQPGSGGRKTSNGTAGPVSMSSTVSGINTNNRSSVGRSRTSVKAPFQSSSVFEGVYNNARMIHFLTAVVGSTCDVRVKNGNVYEGIFKTLGSRCELAVDAVHKHAADEGHSTVQPRREDITDTMVFSPSDVVTMMCRDVDLNFATRDTFTDTAISATRVNGEHKEKVLQRWEGGDSNGEAFDLEKDASNGWDANEMFRYNEVNYGVKSTYDSSLSMYTFPLEKGSTEGFRQREARATRLASEIESSPHYRHRASLENEEGKSEEEKYSAVVRDGGEQRGRESPRERGRDSPGIVSREGKYIPLPQRAREMGGGVRGERAERGPGSGGSTGPGGPPAHNRASPGYRSAPPSSPRPPLPSGTSGPQPPPPSSERVSPLSGRAGGHAPHHPTQGSPSPGPAYSPGAPPPANAILSTASPPAQHGHTAALSQSLSETGRPVNGVSSRTSPKAQRPIQSNRPIRTPNAHTQSTASRSPKSVTQESVPYLDTSSVSMPAQKTSGPAPLFPIDVNEILSTAAKERSAESPGSTEDSKSKVPSIQQRSQIEELRKFGKEFRLQPSGSCSNTTPLSSSEAATSSSEPSPTSSDSKQTLAPHSPSQLQPSASPSADPTKDSSPAITTAGSISDRQSPGHPQPARTPGSEELGQETAERGEGVNDQIKKSTLNPNAKEFNPNKIALALTKPNPSPTPPRPTPPSPSMALPQHPGSQGPIYNTPYLSYVSQIHSVQSPQMYQYTVSTVNQGKYPRAKGSMVGPPRSDHANSGPPQAMLQAAASAAGTPLVASPYPQSYLQYNPQQYSQQQVIQAMTPYPGQPMYSMLQSSARMLGQGGGHPQAMGPLGAPQFPGQGDGSQGPQQTIYTPQSFNHHQGAVHPPQPSSTPTGNQPPPQQHAPSPGQNPQSGPQSLYHPVSLSAPTPPNMPPGHTSPQGSYSLQGYSLHSHQGIPHTYPGLGQLTQAHVQGAMHQGHHQGQHGHPQVVMLQAPPPQQGPGQVPQHPQHGPQQGAHQHFYIGHPQAMPVQTHPSPFHPPGN